MFYLKIVSYILTVHNYQLKLELKLRMISTHRQRVQRSMIKMREK